MKGGIQLSQLVVGVPQFMQKVPLVQGRIPGHAKPLLAQAKLDLWVSLLGNLLPQGIARKRIGSLSLSSHC
ncbi:MAG TPA: hypothetical protein DCR93_37175 [Cytophagales bacterium]|nr:hypothetical protein [Cytophagales bacterium]